MRFLIGILILISRIILIIYLQWNLSYHERPPVFTDHTFLAEGPIFHYNWTSPEITRLGRPHFCGQWGGVSREVLLYNDDGLYSFYIHLPLSADTTWDVHFAIWFCLYQRGVLRWEGASNVFTVFVAKIGILPRECLPTRECPLKWRTLYLSCL